MLTRFPPEQAPWPADPTLTAWGVYLRPDAPTCRAQVETHELLRKQFGLQGAACFMPHATIKGFFQSDATAEELVAALDPVVAAARAFPVHNRGPVRWGRSAIALDIQHHADGTPNMGFSALHTAVVDAIWSLKRADCRWTPQEWLRERFNAHLTLMMADCPDALYDEVADFIDELRPIGSADFTARHVHLYAMTSDDWDGAYWHSFRWRLMHAWTLADPE